MATDPIAAQIAILQRAFITQLPERIAQLEDVLERLPRDPEAARQAHVIVHSLAGAGATFGCPQVTIAARAMEQSMFPGGVSAGKFDAQACERLPALMAILKAEAERATAAAPDTEAS